MTGIFKIGEQFYSIGETKKRGGKRKVKTTVATKS